MILSVAVALLAGVDAFKLQSTRPVKAYSQDFSDRYSPLKYLGGLGPYSQRSGDGISTEVPAGCSIDQVVIFARHGERFPDADDAEAQQKVLAKIRAEHPGPFDGDLAFLNNWSYFMENPGDAGLELRSGPYAGTADHYSFGAASRARYGHLWDGESVVPIFAADSYRVIESARAFGEGFFGYNYTDAAALNILPETESAGANTLSPYYCASDKRTVCDLRNKTDFSALYDEIIFPEFDVAAVRLNKEYGLHLTGSDVGQLFEVAAFDVSARGSSPWLDVFTSDEWISYNYRKTLWFDCYWGPDSPVAKANGASLLNATANLLNEGPSGLPLALNFMHDSDITSFLAGAGILLPTKPLSTKQVTFGNGYDLNDIVPMGARLVLERLTCDAPFLTNDTNLVSSNASASDAFLNGTTGAWNGTTDNITSYFPLNGTYNYTSGLYINATNVSIPINASRNATFGSWNGTTPSGLNLSAPVKSSKSQFVRVILNDAVVPLDFGYDGPGYSCSLTDFIKHTKARVASNNYIDLCKPAEADVPSVPTFWQDYNRTTTYDVQNTTVPWQASSLF